MFKRIAQSFLNLIYPPLCLHCRRGLLNPQHLLCEDCLFILELIDPCTRCSFCFSADCETELRLCPECQKRRSILDGIGAAFDFAGPAASLIKKMKYSNMPYLNKGVAAYMAAQFCRLEWPMPDVIIPVPISLTHLFSRGYNQSALLAESLASLLNRRYCEVLKRKSGDYSQAGLDREQRMALDGEKFICRQGYDLQDKTILLVDDVMTTGSTLRRCAEALQSGYPNNIYALVFCRALR